MFEEVAMAATMAVRQVRQVGRSSRALYVSWKLGWKVVWKVGWKVGLEGGHIVWKQCNNPLPKM